MGAEFSDILDQFLATDASGATPVPMLVKGRLVYPPAVDGDRIAAHFDDQRKRFVRSSYAKLDGVQVLVQPGLDRGSTGTAGQLDYLTFAALQPDDLIESDFESLANGLYAVPAAEVLDYIRGVQDVLEQNREVIRQAARRTKATSILDSRSVEILFDQLPMLLDADSLGRAIDRELGDASVPGREYLNGWVESDAQSARGVTDRMADHVFRRPTVADEFRHRTRAVPTRQLHITAGNSPLVPLISLMHGWASKGATVVKSPAAATAVTSLIGIAMTAAAPDHPVTRNTSLVYWKGGDGEMEDALFTANAFDRLLVWGSPETVESVRRRARHGKAIFLNPRYGLSIIGQEAIQRGMNEAAMRGCADSMIANQQACTSSLVHYVQGSEAEVLEYCQSLQTALARWDATLPYTPPPAMLGRMRMLRRTAFLNGTWFENGKQPRISSAVVYLPQPFDLALHPMSRLIVVRRIDRIEDLIPMLNSSVSTLGVWPQHQIGAIRDAAAACGVSNIMPLGECERIYPGMPHDGMKLLSELVNWTNS